MPDHPLREASVESLRPETFLLWTPPPGRTVATGPEREQRALPRIPLPLPRQGFSGGEPSDDTIGKGLYDYLRQFPDCPLNGEYARLLRDLFPHYLADIGALIVMIDHKEVDAPYLKRQVSYLKILALLDEANAGLRQRLGMVCYELALTFTELADCRRRLLEAMGHLRRAVQLGAADATTLNYLGQIDFLCGDYPGALRHWQAVMAKIGDSPARDALGEKIARLERESAPDHPLVDDLEALAGGMEQLASGDVEEARGIFERLEEQGCLTAELPMAEFFYLLGLSRGRCGDAGGAFEAFEKALELDPEFDPALEAREMILEGKDV